MKILAIDIETSPHLVYRWGALARPDSTSLEQVVRTTEVMCFAAKWVGEDKGTYPGGRRPAKDGTVFYGGLKDDREDMVHAAHDLLGQADVVLHYNGKRFDIPHLNREFLEHGLTPPPPYHQIDLFLTARSKFEFASNRLQHVTQQLGLEGKVEHEGFRLWERCMAGDETAWRKMERYNRRDVTLLEDLYYILRPWISPHPNRALIDGIQGLVCPRCGSGEHHRRGYRHTGTARYAQFQCNSCGGYFRQRLASATAGSAGVAA